MSVGVVGVSECSGCLGAGFSACGIIPAFTAEDRKVRTVTGAGYRMPPFPIEALGIASTAGREQAWARRERRRMAVPCIDSDRDAMMLCVVDADLRLDNSLRFVSWGGRQEVGVLNPQVLGYSRTTS